MFTQLVAFLNILPKQEELWHIGKYANTQLISFVVPDRSTVSSNVARPNVVSSEVLREHFAVQVQCTFRVKKNSFACETAIIIDHKRHEKRKVKYQKIQPGNVKNAASS